MSFLFEVGAKAIKVHFEVIFSLCSESGLAWATNVGHGQCLRTSVMSTAPGQCDLH